MAVGKAGTFKMSDIKIKITGKPPTGAAPRPPYDPDGPPEIALTKASESVGQTLAAHAAIATVAPAVVAAHNHLAELAVKADMQDMAQQLESEVMHAFLDSRTSQVVIGDPTQAHLSYDKGTLSVRGAEADFVALDEEEALHKYDPSHWFRQPPESIKRVEEWEPRQAPKPEIRSAWDLLEV